MSTLTHPEAGTPSRSTAANGRTAVPGTAWTPSCPIAAQRGSSEPSRPAARVSDAESPASRDASG
ncbi:hypothetical protein ACFV6U_16675 [Streptomyces sp. NPDC059810]|uniref:hypothetical protein n=1 Tax=Streptomyces sp. NPDC059810 TaxID=3346956 RepID=UPI00364EE9E6